MRKQTYPNLTLIKIEKKEEKNKKDLKKESLPNKEKIKTVKKISKSILSKVKSFRIKKTK